MTDWAPCLILAGWFVGGYLVGSIPFGWLIGKIFKGVDIRQLGSKNIGATNCGRVCGWPYGAAAFVLDVVKGLLPVLAADIWLFETTDPLQMDWGCGCEGRETRLLMVVLVGASPILGHLFPAWLRFKGGKAVATALGVLLALPMLWWLALAALGVWVITVLITRYVSVGSTAAALALAAGYLYFQREQAWTEYLAVTIFVLLLVAVVILRHRSNYARLLKGIENPVWGRKKDAAQPDKSEDRAPRTPDLT